MMMDVSESNETVNRGCVDKLLPSVADVTMQINALEIIPKLFLTRSWTGDSN